MRQDAGSLKSSIIELEEPRTKAVFREMDGFLCLMSVLASLSTGNTQNPTEDCVRWVFMVINEALEECPSNEVYFRTKVGWEVLADSLKALPAQFRLRKLVLSHLLALSLGDFDLFWDEYFVCEEGEETLESVDEKVVVLKEKVKLAKENGVATQMLKLKHSGALRVLWDLVEKEGDQRARYALYKTLEVLYGVCHRNAGVLASLGIVGDVFWRLVRVRGEKGKDSEREKQVLQKLSRKLMEMGTSTTEARKIFQAAVISGDKERLDPDILDIIRFGMRSRWVEHFSLEGNGAVVVSDEKWTSLPKEGMSFMMWFNPSSLPTGSMVFPLLTAESTAKFTQQVYLELALLPDGKLKMQSSGSPDADAVFGTTPSARVKRGRWTHLTVVWYPRKVPGGHPNLSAYVLDISKVSLLNIYRTVPGWRICGGCTTQLSEI